MHHENHTASTHATEVPEDSGAPQPMRGEIRGGDSLEKPPGAGDNYPTDPGTTPDVLAKLPGLFS